MSLSKDWTPAQMDAIEDKWQGVYVPTKENISASQAERLMNQYLEIREDWVNQYTNALLHAETVEFKRDAAYRIAYFKSNGKSERAKDMDAKDSPAVHIAELQLIEAKTYATRAKLKVDSATLAHHSLKSIYNKSQDEMWLGKQ